MLICSKCKTESEEAGLYTLCPSCGIGFMMSEQELLKAEMEAMEADLSEADLFAMDEIEASMESCAGCKSIAKCTDGVWLDEELGLPEWDFELSFSDMDINEKLLLGLPIEDVVPITYIAEMNYRFLHTFVDGCFVPA